MALKLTNASKVSVKGLKEHPDHEGSIVYCGSFYFNDKKVGTFKEDDWGGSPTFEFVNKDVENKVKEDILESLTTLGFRLPSSNTATPLMNDIEEYISLITTTSILVSLLKKRHKKMISDRKKALKVKSFTRSQLEVFKSHVFVVSVIHKVFQFKYNRNRYSFEIGDDSWCLLPSQIDLLFLKSKVPEVSFFISINADGVMEKVN